MSEPLWILSDVSLGRSQRRLDRVSLTVPAGVTAIIGPSGAGKTSLLNLLVGFEHPDAGRLSRSIDADAKRLPLGWVPPDFGLWPHLSVRQHLETVQSPQFDDDSSGTKDVVQELLEAFGLAELGTVSAGRLSQGEQSRLALARSLAGDPAVLVLDEPLVHVDPVRLDTYWQVIRRHCQSRQTALVFSTHAPEIVLREASQVICLDGGRAVFEGPVEELYHRPPSAQLSRFLGPANWFERHEIADWIADQTDSNKDVCLRPEQLRLEELAESPLIVQLTLTTPVISLSHIRDERTSQVRPVYHRTTADRLEQGMRVLLRMCVLLLMLLIVTGCQRSSAAPEIPVASTRTLKMPVDGSSIPAPRSLSVSAKGELYVLDKAGRVLVYGNDGELARSWFMPDYEIGKPEGVCILKDGRVVVADTHYYRVVMFDRDGKVLQMFGELGEGPGQFIYPVSVTCDDAGHLYVAEYGGNDRIQKFTTDGEWITTMGSFGTEPGQFQRPSGVIWRPNDDETTTETDAAKRSARGTLYVADAINNRVQAFSDDGTFLGVVAGWSGTDGSSTVATPDGDSTESINDQPSTVNLEYPYDIALGPKGNLFVVEYGAGRVTCLSAMGELLGTYGTNGRGDGQFWTPWGIAVGGDGRVYVADTGNKRIVELKP